MIGQLQAIGSRGYSLRWSQAPADTPDYETLVLDILDRAGSVVASDRRPIKVWGSVVTKKGEEAQRAAQIAWAEEVTRHPLPPPAVDSPEPVAAEEPALTEEKKPDGEEIGGPVPSLSDETQADNPI